MLAGEEPDEFGRTEDERDEQAIRTALTNAEFVKMFATSDCVRAALASRRGEILNRDQEAVDARANEARAMIEGQLKDLMKTTKMPGQLVSPPPPPPHNKRTMFRRSLTLRRKIRLSNTWIARYYVWILCWKL